MRVTFLGTGTSRGIPVIGCDCRVCTSTNPRNQRLRSSVLIESEKSVIIDTSVDFRFQMLRYKIKHLDAVLFTHHHVDHILGLDDVYPFNVRSGRNMPVYASPETLRELRITFRYLFENHGYGGVPKIDLISVQESFSIGDLRFEPIPLMHGKLPILGYRVGAFAYLTDTSFVPGKSFRKLEGIRYLALDGLRYQRHPAHFSISEAVDIAARIGAEQTYLIHMSHDVEHEEANERLPAGVELAYDGLRLEI